MPWGGGGAGWEPGLPVGRAYRWSGLNSYFQRGQTDSVAVGGGGAYALKVDDDLLRGASGACDTFSSPGLAEAADFDILAVELWGWTA